MVSELLGAQSMLARGTPLGATYRIALGSVASLALASCAYQPDSFSYASTPFRGYYVNCLDLAIDHRRQPNDSDVIAYEFGNRCDAPLIVDLAAARVYGQTRDGSEIELFAFDPLSEIRTLRLDGRAHGREAVEYPSAQKLESVCVDAASIAHAAPPRWICFRTD